MKKVRKRRFSFLKLLILLLVLYLIICLIYNVVTMPIKNIFVYGNNTLSDQYIINKAGISDYPSFWLTTSSSIKKKLINDDLIANVKINKKLFSVTITIEENYPLFYNSITDEWILKDGTLKKDELIGTVLLNYVPDTLYSLFIDKMKNVDYNILNRISEIKYDPNEVDDKRFYLTMDDGNYVYLTLDKFEDINSYLDIIKSFNGNNGTLYLDSGDYFKLFDE